jgi:hypothetical protein
MFLVRFTKSRAISTEHPLIPLLILAITSLSFADVCALHTQVATQGIGQQMLTARRPLSRENGAWHADHQNSGAPGPMARKKRKAVPGVA